VRSTIIPDVEYARDIAALSGDYDAPPGISKALCRCSRGCRAVAAGECAKRQRILGLIPKPVVVRDAAWKPAKA